MRYGSLFVVVLVALGGGCAGPEVGPVERRATQGVVVGAPIEAVWQAVQEVLPGAPLAGVAMGRVADVRGVPVEARVERYDDARTILHVTSPDPTRAEEVQLAIQRALLR